MFPKIAAHFYLTLPCLQYLSTVNCAARIDRVVLRHLEKFPTMPVLVQFGAHYIKRAIDHHRSTRSKDPAFKLTEPEVTAYIDNLNRISNECQAAVLAHLQSGSCGTNHPEEFCKNIDYLQLWISNEIAIRNADRALINRVANMPNVTEILPDLEVRGNLCGSSPPKPQAVKYPPIGFNLKMLHVKELWEKGYDGRGVIVGIIDSGVSIEHDSILYGNYRGYNYGWMDSSTENTTSPVDPDDEASHGTCVLSLAVGRPDDHVRPVGVAPGAMWMACKTGFTSIARYGLISSYRNCMMWIACPTLPDGSNRNCSKRPTVVNHSWDHENHPVDKNFFDVYEDVNVLLVQSAGNAGPECESLTPVAELDWPIVVGNVDYNRIIVPSSSRGPSRYGNVRPHLVAPGEHARCLRHDKVKNEWFMYGGGTSCAAPHVMGVVALIKSYKPELTAAQLKSVIIRGSWSNHSRVGEPCGNRSIMSTPNNYYGYGITNAYEAYCLAKKNKFLSTEELLDWGIQKYESPCE